jgi:hypothetical protein
MNRIHKICIMIIFIIGIGNPIFSNDLGLTQDVYSKLCGVWDKGVPKTYKRKSTVCKDTNSYGVACGSVSWGMAEEAVNVSLIIDLGADNPSILFPVMGEASVKKITKNGEKSYIIRVKHYGDNIERDLKVSFVDDEKIIFHKMEWFKELPLLSNDYGKDIIYTKTDGPVIKYFKPKVANLRMRSEASSKGKVIRTLTKEDKVLILEKGEKETIEGVKGIWMRVLSDKNEIGWCFDAYLESL